MAAALPAVEMTPAASLVMVDMRPARLEGGVEPSTAFEVRVEMAAAAAEVAELTSCEASKVMMYITPAATEEMLSMALPGF